MKKNVQMIVVLIIIFCVGIASIASAAQDRRPVDGPTPPAPNDPPVEPACPTSYTNSSCWAEGTRVSSIFATALSDAGYFCDEQMKACFKTQVQELTANKIACEAVAGCKLKYRETYDECELGGADNCTPTPGDIEPDPPSFTCTINGSYDITGYRCDRLPAGKGESIA